MTDDRKRNTGGDVELLSLPKTRRIAQHGADFIEVHTAEQMEAYARANVDRALAESRAEVEALRASMSGDAANHVAIERDHHKARAERLAGALGEVETELGPLVGLDHDPSNPIHRALEAAMAALNLEPTQ